MHHRVCQHSASLEKSQAVTYPPCQIHSTGHHKSCILVPGPKRCSSLPQLPYRGGRGLPLLSASFSQNRIWRHTAGHDIISMPRDIIPSLTEGRPPVEDEDIHKGEIKWWPLVHPLTNWSDAATCTLVQGLLAVWHWTAETSESPICPPAPTVLNIGQFLEDIEEHRWGV